MTRQFGTPVVIQNGSATPLHRVEFDDAFHDEDWIQQLLFEHPTLIPFEEIEPMMRGSVPLAREFPTTSGPIDLLFVNGDALLTLVETKLWRNPESRRKVVAQLIHYATALSKLGYSDFCETLKKCAQPPCDFPVEILRRHRIECDDKRFHDAFVRNLQRGRFLLLAVGDGIQEDVEAMAEFLQKQPQLGFTLGLLELGLFRLHAEKNDPIFVQPRLIARTREVVRAVVEVRDGAVSVTTPPELPQSGGASKLSQDAFLDLLLPLKQPDTIEFVRWVLDHAPRHHLAVEFGKRTASLKYVHPETGDGFRFGALTDEGLLGVTHMVADRYIKLHLPEQIWVTYLSELASLIPGAQYVAGSGSDDWHYVAMPDGAHPPLRLLAPNRDQWLTLIDRTIAAINHAMEVKA